jgi:hypothetical protein
MNKDGSMKGKLRKAVARVKSSSVITLHGWVAALSIACTILLSLMGAVWLYRRYAGLDKPYTLLMQGKEDQLSHTEHESNVDLNKRDRQPRR